MPDETSEPLSDNAALNQMVHTLEAILLNMQGAYDTVEGSAGFAPVSDVLSLLREASPTALKTVVSVGPTAPVHVLENGVLIAIVPVNSSRELPLSAKGELQVRCSPSLSSAVAVATFKQTIEV